MFIRRHTLTLTIALLSVVVVACGGGDSAAPADDTAGAISDRELASMMLSLEQFGPEYAGLEASAENGLRTLDQMADQAFDPEDERADLERFGCPTGYQEFYTSPEPADEGSGVFAAGSTLCLFDSVEGAAGYFQDSSAELKTQGGKTSNGVTAETVETFDAQVADEALGAYGSFHTGTDGQSGPRFWVSALAFRHGRLVAVVGIYSYDDRQVQDALRDLAGQMDQGIADVLAGAAPAS